MAQIRIDLAETLVDGMDIKFKAPCACNEITGLIVYYPAENDTIQTKEFTFRDSHGNDLTGIGNLFSKDAYVKVVADAVNGYAYIQNADTNGYLNSAIFGTYTHDAENLIGSGENGKFKATVSGTISSISVNGVSCSVKCGEETSMDLIAGCWYTFILDGTTVNFSSGGAGAGLNFKVVGGTTEPVSPSENMIWVNTDTAITSYVFAAVEPETPTEGMIWIYIGTSSTIAFNALKKNAIQVYPISAKQYISGAWVDKEIKCYQNGEWKITVQKLYIVKGGVSAYTFSTSSNNNAKQFDSYYGVYGSGGGYHSAWISDIDLTYYTTLTVSGALVKGEGFELCVWENTNSNPTYQNHIASANLAETGATLDVSQLSGMCKVGITNVYTNVMQITEMCLE